MKKVLAKNLKVGDVVYDTLFDKIEFSVEKISGSILFLREKTETNLYIKNKDGYVMFNYGNTIWYMED